MTAKRKPIVPVPLDPARNILVLTKELGLRVATYMNHATSPYSDGSTYWYPRDCVATDGKAGIFWRPASGGRRDIPGASYDFDGWEPWADHMFGGRYQTYESALAWMRRALDIRAGTATDFLGV